MHIVLEHLLLADRKTKKKENLAVQRPSILWKLSTSVAVTVRDAVAPSLVSITLPVCGVSVVVNSAVPLLTVQVICPIPSEPDICCRSVMGNLCGMSLP